MSTDAAVRRQAAGPWLPGRNLVCRPVDSLSVYVHIPFCSSRCRYCNFYFETGWSPRILQRTLDTILAESRLFRPWLFPDSARPARVRTVYFGGGTPSVIPPAMLDGFLEQFRQIWQLPATGKTGQAPEEWAFEANPETISPALLAVLGRHGVDRLSLGIQSFEGEALRRLGRRAGTAEVDAALAMIAKARSDGSWRGSLNLDLITGIPGQGLAQVRRDADRLLQAAPDHVSLYSLTEEPGTPLAQGYDAGLWPRPDPEQVEMQVETLGQVLEAGGYHNYEISNYARPGHESRHNLAYWELHPYIGLGPGATGTLPVSLLPPDGSIGFPAIARLTNPSSMAYSRPGRQNWEHQVEILSNHDFLVDHFVVGLRTSQGLDPTGLERLFHLPPGRLLAALNPLLADWRSRGLVAKASPAQLSLNPAGRSLLNPLLIELMTALDPLADGLQDLPCPAWPRLA